MRDEVDDAIVTSGGMAILPAGSGIHGYPTRRIRVRVRNLTRGSHPYPTRDKIGVGYEFYLSPAGPGGYPKLNVHVFEPTRNQWSIFIHPVTLVSQAHEVTVSLSPFLSGSQPATTSRQ
jgi:hypothetical protein